jgi:hypothetical protein
VRGEHGGRTIRAETQRPVDLPITLPLTLKSFKMSKMFPHSFTTLEKLPEMLRVKEGEMAKVETMAKVEKQKRLDLSAPYRPKLRPEPEPLRRRLAKARSR